MAASMSAGVMSASVLHFERAQEASSTETAACLSS
jgi:hypothetical protein